jgi:hypothetical protein
VNARGSISLPAGDPARAEQASRLGAEGVPVDDAGLTPPDRRWRPRLELDEWLWGPDAVGGAQRS